MYVNFIVPRRTKCLCIQSKLWRMMKLSVLFVMVAFMHVSAASNAQQITLHKTNAKLSETLEDIRKQSGYSLLCDADLINRAYPVTIAVESVSLEEALQKSLLGQPFSYKINNRTIVIHAKHESPGRLQQQPPQRQVTGKVVDGNNQPLSGVSVKLKGGQATTVTDADGLFTSLIPSDNATLIFTFIGFASQEVAVRAGSTVNVKMVEESSDLDEVVVVGYGTMRKRDLTGSVSSIKSEDIKRSPVTSFDQAIQGKAAGVQVTQASSAPGGRVVIRVRGGNSLSSSNEPLYVVDGFPISAGSSAGGNGTAQNPLATLNTADIASIEILKDASATAIYGARGANGVVLITTKRGSVGKPQVTFDTYYGVQTLIKKLDMMNAMEYATLVNEARANDGQDPVFPNPNNPHYFPEISSLGKGIDYQDQVFTSAPTQNHNIGINGGNEGIRYSIGGGYFGQEGIIKNSDFNRASFRSNLDIQIIPNLTVNTNISASHIWANGMPSEGDGGGGTGGVVHGAITMPASVPIFDEDGSYTMTNPTPGSTPSNNPIATVNHYKDKQEIDRLLGSVDVNWEIRNDLTLKVTFGADRSTANRSYYWPKETHRGYTKDGEAYQRYRRDASYLNENILTYNKVFGDHSINAMGGFTWQVFHYKSFETSSTGYSTDLYLADNLGAGTTYGQPGSSRTQSQLASYLGRLNYVYKDRYLFTFTARSDGSSKFGANNKWSFFPSVAVAWRASEEEFMQSLDWLSDLKLRTSYGKTGNQNIDSYKSMAMLGTMNYPLGGALNSGAGPNNIPNPDLKWETTATTDVGLDMGLFNNRLSLVVDYYYKKTTDLLWNISTPSSTGFTSIFKNIGSLENKGLEMALGADALTGQFKWNTQLNWSRNRNKVLEIPGYTPSTQGSISGHLKINGSWLEPGLPVGVWNLLKYDGVFQNEEQLAEGPHSSSNDQLGDARFVDRNGDGTINYTDDRMIVGDPNPDFIYGWTNNFSFKGFDLSVYIQGSQGNDILNVQRAETNVSGPWGNQRREMLDRWTPANTTSGIPRARVTVDPLLLQSDWLIEDGSYLRFKTISLGYTFENLKFINSLRLYVTGQNLITITDYQGFDPEVNSPGNSNLQLGVDYNAYPSYKAMLFGMNISF